MGLVIRSRHGEFLESEKASLYHLNKQLKDGKKGRLDKLAKLEKDENGKPRKVVLEDREEIEKEAVGFFADLFQGFHRRGGELGNSPFEPDLSSDSLEPFLEDLGSLSQQEADEVLKDISEEEVRWAIKASKTNKSPGLDGLTAEFRRRLWTLWPRIWWKYLMSNWRS